MAPLTLLAGSAADTRPLIAHVVYRFAVGGLENGVVNLINHMPAERWRHVVVSLTEVEPVFASRIRRKDVRCIELRKPPGQGFWEYPRLRRLFRDLKLDVVHTRNLAALEAQVPAMLARVPARVHGEHGRDVEDLDGSSRRHQWLRRMHRPFVHHYIALSRDLGNYLQNAVGVPPERLTQIYNGVDVSRFRTVPSGREAIPDSPFNDPKLWLVGTVGRMQAVKDQLLLTRAFIQSVELRPELRQRIRLVMVGDGPLRTECINLLQAAGMADLAWLPGERSDVSEVMRGLNCFVLPSLAEGVSNTILEAMASGLPVIATNVGGNAELVADGVSGKIVPAGNVSALATAMARWVADPSGAVAAGRAGRAAAESRFSLPAMVSAYEAVYDRLLKRATSR